MLISIYMTCQSWPLSTVFRKNVSKNCLEIGNFHIKRRLSGNLLGQLFWNLAKMFIPGSCGTYMQEFWQILRPVAPHVYPVLYTFRPLWAAVCDSEFWTLYISLRSSVRHSKSYGFFPSQDFLDFWHFCQDFAYYHHLYAWFVWNWMFWFLLMILNYYEPIPG